jgi:hypothetical protein
MLRVIDETLLSLSEDDSVRKKFLRKDALRNL